MSCTSSRPLGAIWRRLTTQTRNMLKRITPEETSLSSLPYLHTAQALNHSTHFQIFARDLTSPSKCRMSICLLGAAMSSAFVLPQPTQPGYPKHLQCMFMEASRFLCHWTPQHAASTSMCLDSCSSGHLPASWQAHDSCTGWAAHHGPATGEAVAMSRLSTSFMPAVRPACSASL